MKSFLLLYLFGTLSLVYYLFQDTDLEKSMARGQEVYDNFCVACHLTEGEGVAKVFPPLAASDYLKNNRASSIAGVKYGQQGELIVNGIAYNSAMPAMGLDDKEVADVMNFIMNSWGNTSSTIVTVEEVAALGEK